MGREPERLLGWLAETRPRTLPFQAEPLATVSLTWLLQDRTASTAFESLLGVDGPLYWTAEERWREGRPDIVGYDDAAGDARQPRVVIEAKLGAPLDRLQLRDYARHLAHDGAEPPWV